MGILRERTKWQRTSSATKVPRLTGGLTRDEQRHVGAALRFLRVRLGLTTTQLATSVGVSSSTLSDATGKVSKASAALAVATARLAKVSVDDVIAGRWPAEGACAHCGRNV